MSAEEALDLLREARLTVATAESLTGGLVAAALTDVPGASVAVRGGVVAYSSEVKASVLGVDACLLTGRGAVDPDVAAAMATGARALLGADLGVATTGVAGPDVSDGREVGTVFVAVAHAGGTAVREHAFTGSRGDIRAQSVTAALDLLAATVRNVRDAEGSTG